MFMTRFIVINLNLRVT